MGSNCLHYVIGGIANIPAKNGKRNSGIPKKLLMKSRSISSYQGTLIFYMRTLFVRTLRHQWQKTKNEKIAKNSQTFELLKIHCFHHHFHHYFYSILENFHKFFLKIYTSGNVKFVPTLHVPFIEILLIFASLSFAVYL